MLSFNINIIQFHLIGLDFRCVIWVVLAMCPELEIAAHGVFIQRASIRWDVIIGIRGTQFTHIAMGGKGSE